MAMGGSTNTVLHMLAIAHEAGVDYRLGAASTRSPSACRTSARCRRRRSYHVEDVDRAGGVTAILWELSQAAGHPAHRTRRPSRARRCARTSQGAESQDEACIRPLENPYSERGGLAILFGNLAPDGAVVKTAGVLPEMLQHRGPAVIFDSHEEANAGILSGKVKAGRRGGDPLRRAEGRAGHAGDARAHVEHHGHGAGQQRWR